MAAFYSNTVKEFILESENEIFAILATGHLNDFSELTKQQEKSWKKFFRILKKALIGLNDKSLLPPNSAIFLEYKIPRREKRIDCVLILDSYLIIIEFKFLDKTGKVGRMQLEDYCLDLKDFHKESRDKEIFPILLSPNSTVPLKEIVARDGLVQDVIVANDGNLADVLEIIQSFKSGEYETINYRKWHDSSFAPTPTIIEAIKALYKGQNVEEITRHHAGIDNLNKTTDAVVKAIRSAKETNSKVICFITGVPGAGKTLAGLNIAHLEEFQFEDSSLATFLSGNVPLINVLREALKRDLLKKYKRGEKEAKENEVSRISTFIEKVHTFIDTYYSQKKEPPNTKILIFDEAQRAWNKEHKVRKSEGKYNKSEPHILFEIMNRHTSWCAIIALIGGGQEINTGESGLEEWGKTLIKNYKDWKVYISPHLINEGDFSAHKPLFKNLPKDITVIKDNNLHLSVTIRSYNAERLSDWVHSALDLKPEEACKIFDTDLTGFPIYITRNLEEAKTFLKTKRLGTRRVGLVASSGGRRLRAHGVDVDIALDETRWFLNPSEDIRSSNFLELAGKDFKIQGLELDWTCVCWDADFYINDGTWQYQGFAGTKWNDVKKDLQKQFIKNKYRVLMTRARVGMVIWVPEANMEDQTRLPIFYEETYDYLASCGCKQLQ